MILAGLLWMVMAIVLICVGDIPPLNAAGGAVIAGSILIAIGLDKGRNK